MCHSANVFKAAKIRLLKLFPYFCRKLFEKMDNNIVQEVFDLLIKKGMTFASAESCTGGNIAHQITLIAGSSNIFKGTAVTYATAMKTKVLGVPEMTIEKHSVVSQQVVEAMATGVRDLMETDFSVATTGVAGPGGGSEENPVGTVWIGVASPIRVISRRYRFNGNRVEVINQATMKAYEMLRDEILYHTENTES